MQTEYTTLEGYRLLLGSVDRRRLDRIRLKRGEPEPPTRTVEVWGGIEEEIPVHDDVGYQSKRVGYHLWLAGEEASIMVDAITILNEDAIRWTELGELAELGLVIPSEKIGFLLYLVSEHDRSNIIEQILYNSTVTIRGITEAERTYAITWYDQSVYAWRIPGTPGRVGDLFEARQAAQFSHLSWGEFCDLSGPEQSAVWAFHRLSRRLEWLLSMERVS